MKTKLTLAKDFKYVTLAEEIEYVISRGNYDDNWGIWASWPHSLESEARPGQDQFENGGVPDGKVFFASYKEIIDAAWKYCDGDPNAEDCPFSADEIVCAVFEDIHERNLDFYGYLHPREWEPPRPTR